MKKNYDVLRDFIARGESRISTLQRIAGVFVTGAGLLIVLPLMLKDYLPKILEVIYESNYLVENLPLKIILYSALFIIGFIPLYALYQVMIGIAQFYFIKRKIGDYNYLRFYLSGITLPDDEFQEEGGEKDALSKRELIQGQFDTKEDINLLVKYLGHFSKSDLKSFLYSKNLTEEKLIPPKRKIGGEDEVYFKGGGESITGSKQKIDILHTIYGLSGYADVNLADMVSDIETAIVRQTFYLRRLILTYIKAFLMMLFATVILGILHANFTAANKHLDDIRVLKNFEVYIIIAFWLCSLLGGIFIDASILTIIEFSERRQNFFITLGKWVKNKFKYNTISDQKTDNFEHTILILFAAVMLMMNYLMFAYENFFSDSMNILFRTGLYAIVKWFMMGVTLSWIIIFIVSIFIRWRDKISKLKRTNLGKGDFNKNVEDELDKIIK